MRWILSLIACLPLTLSGCRPNPPPTESAAAESAAVESAAVELPAAESPAAESPLETPSEPPAEAAWDVQFAAVRSGRSDRLRIAQQPVTPEQLQQLPQIGEHLRHLLIDRGGVRDQDLATLSQLRRLVHLRIRQSPLSDDGLALLLAGELPELQILNLPQSQLTARGIKGLARLPQLRQLRLGGPQLDDACLAEIAQLSALRSLHLIAPRLSDDGLQVLAKAPRLTSFYLDDCPLSVAAWTRLFSARPQLHVHIDQQHHDRDPLRHEHE